MGIPSASHQLCVALYVMACGIAEGVLFPFKPESLTLTAPGKRDVT